MPGSRPLLLDLSKWREPCARNRAAAWAALTAWHESPSWLPGQAPAQTNDTSGGHRAGNWVSLGAGNTQEKRGPASQPGNDPLGPSSRSGYSPTPSRRIMGTDPFKVPTVQFPSLLPSAQPAPYGLPPNHTKSRSRSGRGTVRTVVHGGRGPQGTSNASAIRRPAAEHPDAPHGVRRPPQDREGVVATGRGGRPSSPPRPPPRRPGSGPPRYPRPRST